MRGARTVLEADADLLWHLALGGVRGLHGVLELLAAPLRHGDAWLSGGDDGRNRKLHVSAVPTEVTLR